MGYCRPRTISLSSKKLLLGNYGFIIMYDITWRKTFDEVRKFIKNMIDETSKNIIIITVGEKLYSEDKREVSKEEGIELVKEFNYSFFECSAKDNININEIMEELAK